jgi:hypothetical protein
MPIKLLHVQVDLMDGPEQTAAFELNPEFMERMRAEALQALKSKA